MSGGYFDYDDGSLKNKIFGWDDTPINVFEDREISELIYDVFDLIHDFDWYKSGDTSERDYAEAKQEFKEKWLDIDSDSRMKRTIDIAVDDLKKELYKTYDLTEV